MAICLVFFNPANSFRVLMNLLYVANRFKRENLPVFILELVHEGKTPQIADAFHVYAKSYMFHKENLCRILEKKIPQQYTKLAFLDADIIFKDNNWYSRVSRLLEEYDVVHPFETICYLNLTYRNIIKTCKTSIITSEKYLECSKGQPGFGWCFRRDWYNKIGFFDNNPIGGGDSFFLSKIMNITYWNYEKIECLKTLTSNEYEKYKQLETPKFCYLENSTIFHLYHGSFKNRNYANRNFIFNDNTKSFEELIYTNEDGVYEWREPEVWNPKFLEYFLSRDDDAIN